MESHELCGPRDRVSDGGEGIGAAEVVCRISRRAIRRMSSPRHAGWSCKRPTPCSVAGESQPTIGADMSAAPAPSSRKRALRRPPTTRSERPIPRTASSSEGLHRVEIVAPDPECAALLLEYASPLFPTELITGPELIVRLQPPPAEPGWVIELLTLVERWLESAPLPCANLLYGGRSYLIRSSTRLSQTISSAGEMRRAGSDA